MPDEYARRQFEPEKEEPLALLQPATILRFGLFGVGFLLVVFGLVLAVGVFGTVRDIVESPEMMADQLDAWSHRAEPEPTPDATAVEPTASTEDTSPTEPEPTGSIEPAQPSPPENPEADVISTEEMSDQERALEALGQLRDRAPDPARSPSPRERADDDYDSIGAFARDIVNLIREGEMGRVAGGFFIFAYCGLLAWISLGIIRIGVSVLGLAANRDSASTSS